MSKISIGYFCSLESFDTGMPISTFKLIEHFAKHPDFLVSAILPAEGELSRRIRQCGIEPRIIPFSRLRSPKRLLEFMGFCVSYPVAFWRVTRFLRKNDIDIVHFSDIIDMPFYPCAALAGPKTVTHLRHCIENRLGRMVFQLFILLFINKVICISKAVLRYSGVLEPKAMVIYNPGPDMALFDPRNHFPKVPQLPQAGTIIVSIGKLLPVKGHEHFLRMARIIESKRPGQCRFVIVGNTAPGREDYPAFIRRNIVEFGLSESVFILDTIPHDQVPAILSRAAIVTHLPNWQEGLGGVVLEAMAMEVPVVAFNCGGIAECFTNGISGILVDQFDVDAAARGVEQLLDDVVLRKKMGAQARTELLSKFSYQRHFSAVESVYRSCSLQ